MIRQLSLAVILVGFIAAAAAPATYVDSAGGEW